MPTHHEIEKALAVLAGGRIAQVGVGAVQSARKEAAAFRALSAAAQARTASATAIRGGKFIGRQAITKNPWGIAALLAYEGYIHREDIADFASSLGGTMQDAVEYYESETGTLPYKSGIAMPVSSKRKVSKANKAVKHAMGLLKAGTKASTGADKGKLPRGAFKTAVKAAGLANPRTPSRIKGKGRIKNLARKLKRWW
jgi:hypothetical protein